MIPGVNPELISRWAERAETGPFNTLATGELLTSDAYDPFIALTTAAAVTRRVQLLANVIVLPLHPAGVVAKQAASLDNLSSGRLLLGLGVGARKPVLKTPSPTPLPDEDLPDFVAAPAPATGRYERFEEQVAYMKRIWSGAAVPDTGLKIGPAPRRSAGPELIVGGYAPRFLERAAPWAAGLSTFGLVPDVGRMAEDFEVVRRAWRNAGRETAPRLIATHFYALGPEAEQGTRDYIERHYRHLGPEGHRQFASAISTTCETTIREVFQALGDAGATDVIPIPMIPCLDQVDRLADLLGA
jgi:alkanesulfonate monooxygenase SsuD/methylene tetrahydromethanopterin reductase-like flavin-dependent oxidoreductase (luciferase family)